MRFLSSAVHTSPSASRTAVSGPDSLSTFVPIPPNPKANSYRVAVFSVGVRVTVALDVRVAVLNGGTVGVDIGRPSGRIESNAVTSAADIRESSFASFPAHVAQASQNGACSSKARSARSNVALQSTSPACVNGTSGTHDGACGHADVPAANLY